MINAIIGDVTAANKITNVSLLLMAVTKGLIESYQQEDTVKEKIIDSIKIMEQKYSDFQINTLDASVCGVVIGRIYFRMSAIERYSELVAEALKSYMSHVEGIKPVASSIGLLSMYIPKNNIQKHIEKKYDINANSILNAAYTCFFQEEDYEKILYKASTYKEKDKSEICSVAAALAGASFETPQKMYDKVITFFDEYMAELCKQYFDFLQHKQDLTKEGQDCRCCPMFKICRGKQNK